MSMTLADIDNAENAVRNVRVALDAIGRELYEMREGQKLGPEYEFKNYYRWQFQGANYCNQEGPDWGAGTLIFSLVYYWPRGENALTVTFPQRWLEIDWRSLERDRLCMEAAAQIEQEKAEKKRRDANREKSERRTFERLKKKFK